MRFTRAPNLLPPALAIALLAACLPTAGPPSATSLPAPSVSLTELGPPPIPACGQTAAPPQYDLDLSLDYATHTAHITQTLHVVNDSGDPWRDLVLPVSANEKPGTFRLHNLTIDAYPATFSTDGVWLRVILPAPLASGCAITLSADYTLELPPLDPAGSGWRAALGWNSRQTLLGFWYPTLAPYRAGVGWMVHPPAPQGEYETTPASDIRVRLTLDGEVRQLQIAASARPEACGEATCYTLKAGRHFALALSDQMEIASSTARDATISSLYFPEHAAAGAAALQTARHAFSVFTDRFGAVPYNSLTVVEADLVDGMEFSGLFFLGKPYYAEYDGTPQNYLTLISAHETAHQWWYSRVGNDPAAEPWLDEALATYSEEIYFETAYPHLVEWWWQFRVWDYLPSGSPGSDIYLSPDYRPYVDAVYLNGAQFLHALRGETGDEAFFKFLGAYAERLAGQIATAKDFWRIHKEFGEAEGSPARNTYFSPN